MAIYKDYRLPKSKGEIEFRNHQVKVKNTIKKIHDTEKNDQKMVYWPFRIPV